MPTCYTAYHVTPTMCYLHVLVLGFMMQCWLIFASKLPLMRMLSTPSACPWWIWQVWGGDVFCVSVFDVLVVEYCGVVC